MSSVVDRVRQSTVVPILDGCRMEVIGCGAIGSHFCEMAAKIGVGSITVWDDDTVEAHNLPNQGFYIQDLGKKKVQAIKDRLEAGLDASITAVDGKFTAESNLSDAPIIVSALDSIPARKTLWEVFLKTDSALVFVDHRMGGMAGSIHILNKLRPDFPQLAIAYEGTFWTEDQIVPEPCTERSTLFCAYAIVSFSFASLLRVLKNDKTTVNEVTIDMKSVLVMPETSTHEG